MKSLPEITVVGAGHGGTAQAAILANRGYAVNLLKMGRTMHGEHYTAMRKTMSVMLKGIYGEHVCSLRMVTDNPSEVVGRADIILIYYVANHHEAIAEQIAPYLRPHHLVYLCPGYLGTLFFVREYEKYRKFHDIAFVEGETLPYTSRITGPAEVTISSHNVRHPIAVLPASAAFDAVNRLTPLLGKVEMRASMLEVALHNPNLVIHTVGTLMNISRVEDPTRNFSMYRDGFSPSIWKLVEGLDAEKMATLTALGCIPRTYFEEFLVRTFEDPSSITPLNGFKQYADESPDGPFTLDNRYITEDVPIGLGLLVSVAQHLRIPTPVANLLLNLASITMGRDFCSEARSTEKLGFNDIRTFLKRIQHPDSAG